MSNRARRAPRLIAFEGVDGAGKTTALALVAERLRARGDRVFLPRVGKHHTARTVRIIRDMTRDRRHVEIDPRTELLLYCARESQILAELVRPALRDGQTVLIDRSVLTAIVLGRARGVPRDECERAAAVAAGDLQPDLTLVFDVHPRTSRLRKRLERLRSHSDEEGGRKGLAGSAFKERVRDLYGEAGREHGYPLIHAERASPDVLAERVLRLIDHGPGVDTGERTEDAIPRWQVTPDVDLGRILEDLPIEMGLYFGEGLVSARGLRGRACHEEPALCAATLDSEDPLREALAEREPYYALRPIAKRPIVGGSDLRLRLLSRHPEACIEAFRYQRDGETDRIRVQFAERYPDAVLASLVAREDETAERLRERCWALGQDRARAISLAYCRSDIAWRRRLELFERDPLLGLRTVRGLVDPRVDRWLEEYSTLAPKAVLGALGARTDDASFRLRDSLFDTGREVLDGLRGVDHESAWALRDRALSLWPAEVVASLLGLETNPRAKALIERCASIGAGDLHVMRRLRQLEEHPLQPEWARSRGSLMLPHEDA